MQDVEVHCDRSRACLNCGAALCGAWCHQCGQQAGLQHRSLMHLGAELFETLTHADSRFWRTLTRLVWHPALLTGDYLQGRRAREIPPLRLFLVMLFLLFSIGSLTHTEFSITTIHDKAGAQINRTIDSIMIGDHPQVTQWLHLHLHQAFDHPDGVMTVIREWSERFTILMLPIASCILWLLYLVPRRVSLYDHTIVSIHSLCFASLVIMTLFLLRETPIPFSSLLLLVLPVHLFLHMRGVYRSSVFGTLIRMALLAVGSTVAVMVLLLGLAVVGLQLGAHA
ncbi:DUF3667 domain-containing protein [Lichenicola cladoniae]|uniref:DUF3667 domain-containing protein n=1 Tax=Lichenicola cladoniae TaxID=1484109 RepID=A0A6M8HMW9_9PROT|nr:DUF3667 domain-containing protein [Lichenicola cladoniae]NPD67122.1 DUF3667 domain-containing protein [Acetobacteraceae bacterium]QKE89656.1 DUF3667 domain-containing protein [Lichenicola cladoniae]